MANRPQLTKPAGVEAKSAIVTLGGTSYELVQDIKDLYRGHTMMSQGEIINRIITDYDELCRTLSMINPFEIPYLTTNNTEIKFCPHCGGDQKITHQIPMWLHSKALALVNATWKYCKEERDPKNKPLIIAYYVERHVALISQRQMNYIDFFKTKYRVLPGITPL